MGIESQETDTIAGLDASWPLGNDPTLDGDNHLRLIKRVLKAIFPGDSGEGFAKPIIATETEINYLTGLDQNVQEALEYLNGQDSNLQRRLCGPNGLVLPTYNTSSYAVPNGWKLVPVSELYMMVVATPEYQGTFSGKDAPTYHVHSHSQSTIRITAAHLPPHAHSLVNTRKYEGENGQYSNHTYYITDPQLTIETATTGPGWGSNDPIQLPNTNNNGWEPKAAGFKMIQRDINLGQG
jgi:hypothetical protein